MGLPLGFGGTWFIAQEATWGTAAARTNAIRMNSVGLIRNITRELVPHLGDIGQVSTNPKHDFVKDDMAGGPGQFCLAYDDSSLMLLRHMFGTVADSGAPSTYTHLFSLASALPVGLTIEQINGTPGTVLTNMTEVFEGCRIASWSLGCEAGGLLTADVEVIAQTSGGIVAAGSPTLPGAPEYIKHNHAGAFTFNSVVRPFRSFKLNVSRGMQRNQEMGSNFTSEPFETQLDVMLEVTTLWQQSNWYSEYLAGTQADGTLTFTGSTSPNSCALTFQGGKINSVKRAVSAKGAILETISMRLFADAASGSDQGVTLSMVNDNALYTDNG